MDSVVVDTGVWYALCDNRDSNYKKAGEKIELLDVLNVDDNTNVRYLATFNARDFFDVCDRRRVEMI